jgi:hypothetical protein
MAPVDGNGLNDERPDFLGQEAQLRYFKAADVRRRLNFRQGYGSGRWFFFLSSHEIDLQDFRSRM